MAVYSSKISVGFVLAGEDLSADADQFQAVKLDSNGKYVRCDTLGELVDGVINHPAGSDEALGVDISGFVKAKANAAITAGALVSVAANGKFKVAASTENIVGKAQSAAGAADEIFTMDLGFRGVAP